jgi:hypothetical protein
VGLPVPVVVVVVLVEVDVVLVGGIPQMVSLGSFTHWLVLRLQHVTPVACKIGQKCNKQRNP